MHQVKQVGWAGPKKNKAVYSVVLGGRLPEYFYCAGQMHYIKERRNNRGAIVRRPLPVVSSVTRKLIEDAVRAYQVEEIKANEKAGD
ncbi:hypothetical protein HOU67_gp52 [Escherichia phage Skarpretter]|uniref:Uncharacterized protein n=1 Tax=Escherichia phage Skarpretter TaxID=2488654 RepID=A0A3G8F3H0_9CAUD|nr:hypothetical protein HOU67_gp52 [Escherichia phage Skarpretter]AZF88688.1 hypothetical protein [Escherichia phage Skarpretter]